MTSAGAFSFSLVGGNSKKGSVWCSKRDRYNLWRDTHVYTDVDLLPTALPAFKKAGDILIEWFYTKRPWRVYFSASTDRKVKIYRWFAKRLERRLPEEFQLIEFPEGQFEFYRATETPSKFV